MSVNGDRRKVASLGMLAVLLITPFFTTGAGGGCLNLISGGCQTASASTANYATGTRLMAANTVYCSALASQAFVYPTFANTRNIQVKAMITANMNSSAIPAGQDVDLAMFVYSNINNPFPISWHSGACESHLFGSEIGIGTVAISAFDLLPPNSPSPFTVNVQADFATTNPGPAFNTYFFVEIIECCVSVTVNFDTLILGNDVGCAAAGYGNCQSLDVTMISFR